jgi:hypothetical protein
MGRAAAMRWQLPALLVVLLATVAVVRARPQVPCYFVFGDSLVDNGNNNDIASLARANYPPYGIDFAGGPTGRFSNGLTTVDAICKLVITTYSVLLFGSCDLLAFVSFFLKKKWVPFLLSDPLLLGFQNEVYCIFFSQEHEGL